MTTKTEKRRHGSRGKPVTHSEVEFFVCEVCEKEYRADDPEYVDPCPECGVLACVDCWFMTFDLNCPNCERQCEEYRPGQNYREKDIFQDA